MTLPDFESYLPVSHVSEFLLGGAQKEKTQLPAGVFLVTLTTSTITKPRAFVHGGWYSYKPLQWAVGESGQWRSTVTVASKSVTDVYFHIGGNLDASDPGSPIVITYQKIG